MAYPIMPFLPISMAAEIKKSPVFNTVRHKGSAGINSGITLKPYPTWAFRFSLENIVGHEQDAASTVAQFMGTFMATAGGANLFLFADPQDNTVTHAQFGLGDGVTTAFQLSRNIYGYPDIVQNVDGTPTIYVSGSVTAPASISNTGVVTFSSAPALGEVLTWTGSFRYLCRFSEDTIDATRSFTINNGLDHWMFSGIKFSSEFRPTSTYGAIAAPGGL
ncbi:MAG: DUF2460 domain-containing protein [Edaphobacter sp.]